MCGRYFSRGDKQRIADRFGAKRVTAEPVVANYNVAPATFQPVIRQERDSEERELVLMRWGLIPFSAKTLAEWKGTATINAKAETVTANATYRGPFQSRRCLVPVDGFYEWKKLNDAKKGPRQPYAFTLREGGPFALAGLWDAWKEPKKSPQMVDTWLQTFTILTTEANELMAPVHDRMPVILHERDWARWLDRTVTEPPPVDLLRPFDAEAMVSYPVDARVGSVKNNEPGLCEACPPNSA